MPVVFRDKGFRFFFYSNEGNPREPHSTAFWQATRPGLAVPRRARSGRMACHQ